ncbi:MAG: hypothetical protein EXR53_02170 [Dehalococcoidia bacterium]|nr:hypothetical protein [Dehalococcoidia bacterium]
MPGQDLYLPAGRGVLDAGANGAVRGNRQDIVDYHGTPVFFPAFATDRTLFAVTIDDSSYWHVFALTFGYSYTRIYRSADAGQRWMDLGLGPSLPSLAASATAFALGIAFALVLAGALLVTRNIGGLGRVVGWWRPLWAVTGLGTGGLLILWGLVDDSTRLVYVGGANIALLALGLVGPLVSKRLAGTHQPRP